MRNPAVLLLLLALLAFATVTVNAFPSGRSLHQDGSSSNSSASASASAHLALKLGPAALKLGNNIPAAAGTGPAVPGTLLPAPGDMTLPHKHPQGADQHHKDSNSWKLQKPDHAGHSHAQRDSRFQMPMPMRGFPADAAAWSHPQGQPQPGGISSTAPGPKDLAVAALPLAGPKDLGRPKDLPLSGTMPPQVMLKPLHGKHLVGKYIEPQQDGLVHPNGAMLHMQPHDGRSFSMKPFDVADGIIPVPAPLRGPVTGTGSEGPHRSDALGPYPHTEGSILVSYFNGKHGINKHTEVIRLDCKHSHNLCNGIHGEGKHVAPGVATQPHNEQHDGPKGQAGPDGFVQQGQMMQPEHQPKPEGLQGLQFSQGMLVPESQLAQPAGDLHAQPEGPEAFTPQPNPEGLHFPAAHKDGDKHSMIEGRRKHGKGEEKVHGNSGQPLQGEGHADKNGRPCLGERGAAPNHGKHGVGGDIFGSKPFALRPDGNLLAGKPCVGDKPCVGGKPFDGKPFDGKPFDGKPFGGKPFGGKPFDGKPCDGKPCDGKPFMAKPTGEIVNGGKPLDGQPLGGKAPVDVPYQQAAASSAKLLDVQPVPVLKAPPVGP